ncbi:hypothetical protein K438DRAFT_1873083 [Mycena galopus ATCC 62051]|nr:hypothetical protein K438DRAFT_1873083 [Mycena galopus ATCC 62051]
MSERCGMCWTLKVMTQTLWWAKSGATPSRPSPPRLTLAAGMTRLRSYAETQLMAGWIVQMRAATMGAVYRLDRGGWKEMESPVHAWEWLGNV